MKRLITTVTYTFEREINDEVFEQFAEDGDDEEAVMRYEEEFIYDEFLNRIEGRIDNLCCIWSRDRVTMNWEEG